MWSQVKFMYIIKCEINVYGMKPGKIKAYDVKSGKIKAYDVK